MPKKNFGVGAKPRSLVSTEARVRIPPEQHTRPNQPIDFIYAQLLIGVRIQSGTLVELSQKITLTQSGVTNTIRCKPVGKSALTLIVSADQPRQTSSIYVPTQPGFGSFKVSPGWANHHVQVQ